MKTITVMGWGGFILLSGCAHGPTTDERLTGMQEKIDHLSRQVETLRFEVTQDTLEKGSHGKRKRPNPERDTNHSH